MDWIVFSIYRWLALPTLFVLARILLILNLKNKFFDSLKFRLNNEFHFRPTFDSQKKSIGVHAASGEIEYALPLIRKLKQLHPQYNVVVTLSSASVLKSVINQPDVDAVGPAPLDLFWRVRSFISRFNFKLFLFARTDVWPEISSQLEKENIPSFLFSATFSLASSQKTALANLLVRGSLNQLNKIFVVSESDKTNLETIKIKTPIQVLGDTRYDQVFHKKDQNIKDLPAQIGKNKKIFVAGSTWPEDDAVLFPALTSQADTWDYIIAPHEVHEETLARFEHYFSKNNLSTIRLSKLLTHKPQTKWNVLIVDLYGYLFHLYAWADLAFVGGSFKSKIHSVMEPLSFFKPVCVGPFHKNNREAIAFSQIKISNQNTKWVQVFQTSSELESLLVLHSQISTQEKDKMTRELETFLNSHKDATTRTYNEITRIVQLN